jgi:hypothetical protein
VCELLVRGVIRQQEGNERASGTRAAAKGIFEITGNSPVSSGERWLVGASGHSMS